MIEILSTDKVGDSRADINANFDEIVEKTNVNGYDRYTAASMPDVTFDDSTRTISVAVKSGSSNFYFWTNNVKITKTTTQTVTIPDVTGAYYIYFDNSGVLQYILQDSVTSIAFYSYAITAFVYWNASNSTYLLNNDELHGKDMAGITHESLHMTVGARYASGLVIEGLSDGSATYTQSTSGQIFDEDIPHSISSNSSGHKMLYRYGSDGAWRTTTADLAVGHTEGGSYYTWNEWDGSTWKWTEGTSSTDYWITFFIATPNGVMKIAGQNAYSSKSKARAAIETEVNNISIDGLPSPELVWLGAVIVKRNGKLVKMADGSTFYDLKGARGGGAKSTGTSYASDIPTDVTNFDGNLSSTDVDVQTALETLDDMSTGGSGKVSIYQVQLSGVTPNGTYALCTIPEGETIANVRWTSAGLPVGSNRTLDIRRNGTASTDSIFTSDTAIAITTGQSATNGKYTTEGSAIDNGTCSENDIIYFTLAGGSTSGTWDDFITIETS